MRFGDDASELSHRPSFPISLVLPTRSLIFFFFFFAVLISFSPHVFKSGGPFRKWVCVDSLESMARYRAGTREEVEWRDGWNRRTPI